MFLRIYTYMCACIHDTYVKKVDSRDNLGSKSMEGIIKERGGLGDSNMELNMNKAKRNICMKIHI